MNSPIHGVGLTRGRFSSLSLVVTALGILSLLLGFGRELFIVWQFGIGRVTDAYFIAAFIPQIVYQLIVAGPVLAALVPEFNRIVAERGTIAMQAFAEALLGRAAVVLAIGTGLLMIGAPVVARLSAPGYDAARLGLTSQLLTILAPQIISFGSGSVLVAVLYTRGRVLPSVLAQVVNNGLVLLCIAALYRPLGIQGIAAAVTIASVGYIGWLFAAVRHSGSMIVPRLHTPRYRERFVVTVLLPLVGISVLNQLAGFWERLFASLLPPGQLSGISYGYRILFVAQAASAAVGAQAPDGLGDRNQPRAGSYSGSAPDCRVGLHRSSALRIERPIQLIGRPGG